MLNSLRKLCGSLRLCGESYLYYTQLKTILKSLLRLTETRSLHRIATPGAGSLTSSFILRRTARVSIRTSAQL